MRADQRTFDLVLACDVLYEAHAVAPVAAAASAVEAATAGAATGGGQPAVPPTDTLNTVVAPHLPLLLGRSFVGSVREIAGYDGDIVLSTSPEEKMKPGVAEYLKKHRVLSYAFGYTSAFEEFQSVPTSGAADWEHFEISGAHYLAVANVYVHSNSKLERIYPNF